MEWDRCEHNFPIATSDTLVLSRVTVFLEQMGIFRRDENCQTNFVNISIYTKLISKVFVIILCKGHHSFWLSQYTIKFTLIVLNTLYYTDQSYEFASFNIQIYLTNVFYSIYFCPAFKVYGGGRQQANHGPYPDRRKLKLGLPNNL